MCFLRLWSGRTLNNHSVCGYDPELNRQIMWFTVKYVCLLLMQQGNVLNLHVQKHVPANKAILIAEQNCFPKRQEMKSCPSLMVECSTIISLCKLCVWISWVFSCVWYRISRRDWILWGLNGSTAHFRCLNQMKRTSSYEEFSNEVCANK